MVERGDTVSRGQIIGTVGGQVFVHCVYLHFELRHDGQILIR